MTFDIQIFGQMVGVIMLAWIAGLSASFILGLLRKIGSL